MWVLLSLISSCLHGFYDVFKKNSLKENAVIPILVINCVICASFFVPSIVASRLGWIGAESGYYTPQGSLSDHLYIVLKAFIVLTSWICGYFAIKHLPLTIVGPVNATRPVLVLVGAMLFYGENLNALQWMGVITAILSLFLLSLSGKKEGIDFRQNKWIWLLGAACVTGAMSGLYDKFLMRPAGGGPVLDKMFVQGWYNIYQSIIMAVILLIVWLPERTRAKASGKPYSDFEWRWTIPFISICLTLADVAYLSALSQEGAMISIIAMIRRSSVLVSFMFGALLFKEKNLRGKAADLLLVLVSLALLVLGSR